MSDIDELPVFPTSAPGVFADPAAIKALLLPVLADLAAVVDVADDQLDRPTPCDDFTAAELRRHVLAWLQFFAAALGDPSGAGDRLDPETWHLAEGQDPAVIVRRAAVDIEAAVDTGAAGRMVTMSQARMAGDGVLAMMLGEYLVHGWDLAVSTGRRWAPHGTSIEPALGFLRGMVRPEYRGGDGGHFGEEVAPPADATPLEQLLCFAGRAPNWSPSDEPNP